MDWINQERILARNIRYLLDEHPEFQGQIKALAKLAKVAGTSIGYMLKPHLRAPTKRGVASPRLYEVVRVASALGVPTWQLLHPDIAITKMMAEEELSWRSIVEEVRRIEEIDRRISGYLPPPDP